MQRPTIVCICGSTRFTDVWRQANLQETLAGHMVFSVGVFVKPDSEEDFEITRHIKAKLDVLHMHKIQASDEILVLNVDGYVGESTEREIEMAISCGKGVRWWEPEKIPEQWADNWFTLMYPIPAATQRVPYLPEFSPGPGGYFPNIT